MLYALLLVTAISAYSLKVNVELYDRLAQCPDISLSGKVFIATGSVETIETSDTSDTSSARKCIYDVHEHLLSREILKSSDYLK